MACSCAEAVEAGMLIVVMGTIGGPMERIGGSMETIVGLMGKLNIAGRNM